MKNPWSKLFSTLTMLCVVWLGTASCSKDDEPQTTSQSGPQTILKVAESSSDMSLFAEAIKKTSLSSTLSSESNLTAFIPTNDVFGAFLADLGYNDIDAWLTVAKLEVVQQRLLYHILNDQFAFEDLATGYAKTHATNDDGHPLDVYMNTSSGVYLNGNIISIVEENIGASNGVIHKINGILKPQNIGDFINNNPDFTQLKNVDGLAENSFIDIVSSPNTSFTMLVPNNGAFNQFFSERSDISNTLDMLTVFGSTGLQHLFEYHILLGNVRADDFTTQSYQTRNSGRTLNIINNGGNLSISDTPGRQSFFLFKDISATNGSIHIISNVLLNN